MIDVRRVNCKMLYVNCLIFCCVCVAFKMFVSKLNVSIVGDVLYWKECSVIYVRIARYNHLIL